MYGLWFFFFVKDVCIVTQSSLFEPQHYKTNYVTVRPVGSESSLSSWRNLGSLATHLVHSEDSDQTWLMPRLIWFFAGCTVILLVLSCHGSFKDFDCIKTQPTRTSYYFSVLKSSLQHFHCNWTIFHSACRSLLKDSSKTAHISIRDFRWHYPSVLSLM